MIYVILLCYFFVVVYKTFAWIYVYRKLVLKKDNNEMVEISSDKDCPDMFIIIPGLREQSIVEKTINFFSNLKYNINKIKIIIVTTQKENIQKEYNKENLT